MQQFKIRKEGFKEIRKRYLYITISVYLTIILVVTIVPFVKSGSDKADISSLPFTFILLAVILTVIIYRNTVKQKKLLESYVLIIDKNLIAREMINVKPVSIYFNEISSIAKNKKGSFIVRGKSAQEIIIITSQIENYSEVENILRSIKPFDNKPALTFLQRYSQLAGLLSLVLFVLLYISNNKIIVALSGIILSTFLGWSFYKILTNKNVSGKAKRNAWWILLVIISIISVTILKIIGKY